MTKLNELPPKPGFDLPKEHHLMISAGEIEHRTAQLAAKINPWLVGCTNQVFGISLMNGGLPFFHAMQRHLDPRFTPVCIQTRKYGDKNQGSREVEIQLGNFDPTKLRGETVILFEDIVDEGDTMAAVLERMRSDWQVADVRVCALLDKPSRRQVDGITIDFLGFEIDDRWVFGYGMDDGEGNNWVRNLSEIYYYGSKLATPGYRIRE